MTDFITRYLRNISLVIGLLLCSMCMAQAEGIVARRAEAELTSDGQLSVSTRFQSRLTNSLSDALAQGVVFTFRLEFELTRPRLTAYYLSVREWFDPNATISFKLSYQSLTNRYRVNIGSLSSYYATLSEALNAIGAIQGWRVLDFGTLDPKSPGKVSGRVRLLLDISELPKPFQLNAFGSSDWSLSSNWTSLDVKEGN